MEQRITTITHPRNSISAARQKQIKAEFAVAGVIAIFISYDPNHPTPSLDRFFGEGAITPAPEPEPET